MFVNQYYDRKHLEQVANAGTHREAIGGLWDELGLLQLRFLKQNGLTTDMKVLDIGCGCLRAGVHLVDFLEAGNYFGVDISQELLDAGYDIELAAVGLQHKLPRANLITDGDFSFHKLGQHFDAAIAQSVFTHLTLNHIRVCLARLAEVMKAGASLYATFFECPEEEDLTSARHHERGGITTFPANDPYHYKFSDLEFCVRNQPYHISYIGDWDHPRDQMIVKFTLR